MAVQLVAVLGALLGLVLEETLFPLVKGGQKRIPFSNPSFCFGPCLLMPLGCSLGYFWLAYVSSAMVKSSSSSPGSGTSSPVVGRGFDRRGKGECWLSTCSTREFKACIPTRTWLSICSMLGVVSVAWPLSVAVVPWWFGA